MQALHLRQNSLDDDDNEAERLRLEAVDRLDVLDTPREQGFDGIARLVRTIFKVPIGIVSVIDGHRQWHKASEGVNIGEVPRKDTFCHHAVRGTLPLVVNDALTDPRFFELPHVAGEPHIRFYAGVPLRTRDGHNIGTLCAMDYEPRTFTDEQVQILKDLARVAIAEFELRQLVAVDALTGVMSRRAFKDEGTRALALARRHQLDLSCVTFDLDHFKKINDTRGHAAGDVVLAGVAAACRALVRRTDSLGRLGGEEFALILPHTDRRGAMEASEKLRAAIAASSFPLGATTAHVTASFGIATLNAEMDDFDGLLARADAALYQAKAAGRDRCVVWRGSEANENSVRRRVLKAGVINFNHHSSTIDCTIRTLSDDGAGIDVSSTVGVPDNFTLRIKADDFETSCRVASRTERHLEVDFT